MFHINKIRPIIDELVKCASTRTHAHPHACTHTQMADRQHCKNYSFILRGAQNMEIHQNLKTDFSCSHNTFSRVLCISESKKGQQDEVIKRINLIFTFPLQVFPHKKLHTARNVCAHTHMDTHTRHSRDSSLSIVTGWKAWV
jgi:hypothetical protein